MSEEQDKAAGSADNQVEEQEAGANPRWERGEAHSSAGDASPPLPEVPVNAPGVVSADNPSGAALPDPATEGDDLPEGDEDEDKDE